MWHTADNYQRIAAFVQTSDRMSGAGGRPSTAVIACLSFSAPLATDSQTMQSRAPGLLRHQSHQVAALQTARA